MTGDEQLVPDPRTVAVEERPYRHGHHEGHPVSHQFWYEAGLTVGLRRGRRQGVAGCLVVVLIVWTTLHGLGWL